MSLQDDLEIVESLGLVPAEGLSATVYQIPGGKVHVSPTCRRETRPRTLSLWDLVAEPDLCGRCGSRRIPEVVSVSQVAAVAKIYQRFRAAQNRGEPTDPVQLQEMADRIRASFGPVKVPASFADPAVAKMQEWAASIEGEIAAHLPTTLEGATRALLVSSMPLCDRDVVADAKLFAAANGPAVARWRSRYLLEPPDDEGIADVADGDPATARLIQNLEQRIASVIALGDHRVTVPFLFGATVGRNEVNGQVRWRMGQTELPPSALKALEWLTIDDRHFIGPAMLVAAVFEAVSYNEVSVKRA